MKIPGLTASYIESFAAEGSFERGREYVDAGAVVSVRRTGPGHLESHVKGSHYMPYTVIVNHDDDGIVEVECSCPYFAGGWCKHIVAALLAYLEGDYDAEGWRRTLASLQELDARQTVELLEALLRHHPEIASLVDDELARLRS